MTTTTPDARRELGRHPEVPIPPALDRRPKHKNYPIPYVMFIDARGVPDFRVNDEDKRLRTMRKRLCALCGETLPPAWAAFIAGPKAEEFHLFIDGPMHEDCARYAMTVCPYIAAPNAHHANTGLIERRHEKLDPELELRTDEAASESRPERMGLFLGRVWRIVRVQGLAGLYFHVPNFERVEWYA